METDLLHSYYFDVYSCHLAAKLLELARIPLLVVSSDLMCL